MPWTWTPDGTSDVPTVQQMAESLQFPMDTSSPMDSSTAAPNEWAADDAEQLSLAPLSLAHLSPAPAAPTTMDWWVADKEQTNPAPSSPGGLLHEGVYLPVPTPEATVLPGPPASAFYVPDIVNVTSAEAILKDKFPKADTLIVFNLPPAAERKTCRRGMFPSTLRLPYDSATLRKSGLDALPKLLDNERYQKRQRRYLESDGYQIWDQFKYVLDLGPSSDEDLRSQQLAALTLPEGVIRWSLMADYYNAPKQLAGAHDDICCCAEEGCDMVNVTEGFWEEPLAKFRQIPDYSEVRHISCVVRMLLALAGSHIELNSAARVYTIAGLAQMFEIRQAKVFENDKSAEFADSLRSQVYDWFYRQSNFIEMLPEITLTIGYNFKIATITQTAFRILVAEEAIMSEAASKGPKGPRPKYSPFGRKLGDLDEDMITTIEHATKSFKEHMTKTKNELLSLGFLETLKVPEYECLLTFGKQISRTIAATNNQSSYLMSLKSAYESLKRAIDLCFQEEVKEVVAGRFFNSIQQDAIAKNKGLLDHKTVQFQELLDKLNTAQKTLTAAYWSSVGYMAPIYERSWVTPRISGLYEAYKKAYKAGHIRLFRCNPNNPAESLDTEYYSVIRAEGIPPLKLKTEAEDIGVVGDPPRPFDFNQLREQIRVQLSDFAERIYSQPHMEEEPPMSLPLSTYLLLGLRQKEFNFLPLWAGGNDDGTGGAFATHLPVAELGPIGPGPAYTTGITIASESGFEHMSQAGTTTVGMNSSAIVQDGVSTVYDRKKVLSDTMEIVEEEEEFEGIEFGDGEDIYGLSDDESETGKANEAKNDVNEDLVMDEDSDDFDDGDDNEEDGSGNEDNDLIDLLADEMTTSVTKGVAKLSVDDQNQKKKDGGKDGKAKSGDGDTSSSSDSGFSLI